MTISWGGMPGKVSGNTISVLLRVIEALAANLAPAQHKGRYLGFQGLLQSLGQALGPLLGGLGFEHYSGRLTPVPWLAAGALAGAAGWGFWRLGHRINATEEGLVLQEVSS